MSKPRAVVDAEYALAVRVAEVASTEALLKRQQREELDARAALRAARLEADAARPQCRIVTVRFRSGEVNDLDRAVIVRRTPGGMLVVRPVGDADDREFRFKWSEHSATYRQTEKPTSYASDIRELRDVPTAFLPETPAS